jgi:hypothetical protein
MIRLLSGIRVLLLLLVCGCLLATEGLAASDWTDPSSVVVAGSADHDHSEALLADVGHCHPGIDCATPGVIAIGRILVLVSDHIEMLVSIHPTVMSGWNLVDDPPPPRFAVS